jgi:hypothetical protein
MGMGSPSQVSSCVVSYPRTPVAMHQSIPLWLLAIPFYHTPKYHAPLSVKFGPLDIDPIILHRHSQVLHCQHRPALPTSTLSTSSKSTPLHPELDRLSSFSASCAASRATCRGLPRYCGAHATQWVVCGGRVRLARS